MPIRFKSQPFLGPASRFSAPLYRRASGLCLCGTLLCRHCSALFSTIQCYARATLFFAQAKHFCPFPKRSYSVPRRRRSIQSLGSALPVDASAGQISSQPYHTVALPSYALPQPCGTIPWHRFALLFPGIALLHSDAPCQNMTAQCISISLLFGPMLCPGFSLLCLATARRCIALADRRLARTCLCSACADLLMTLPKRDFSMHCLCKSVLSRYGTRLCNSGAELNATVPLRFSAFHCLCESVLYKSNPLPSESLLRLSDTVLDNASPVPITSILCDTGTLRFSTRALHYDAGTIPCLAKPLLLNAFP